MNTKTPLTFKQLQTENREWVMRNFGVSRPNATEFWKPVLGVMEELGELSHALLKRSQGIRGSYEEHTEKAKDAIADATVFLADVCSALGFDYQEIVETAWNEVKQRDWTKNKNNGTT
ncbi:MAG: hypothetical protein KY428_07645 [Bacteroidetes bacterium]|nr:hypothetical protein [Bacteroidota bacterium]